jgi:deoxyribodipyrimidine photo-lyase
MSAPTLSPPDRVARAAGIAAGDVRDPEELGLAPSTKTAAQTGGETRARAALESFLEVRSCDYRTAMSSPNSAWEGCSRLSPYLAFGNLSMREAHQATTRRMAALRRDGAAGASGEIDGAWLKSLASFQSRLSWHCHFMQKLEDEPRLEFENMNRALDGLREASFNERYFRAWQLGETGYPLVDACMRALHATGWINFRMRAMLVSFAAYHLWLHWRRPAVYLARQFVDYEPGIHYSQFQMQSGVTGINTVRIYSPVKQVRDQDADGAFIRRWVPELAGVPEAYLPEPHRMPRLLQEASGCVVGRDYPPPVVPHGPAYAEARRRMAAARKLPEVRAASTGVYQRHGSRRRPSQRGWR